MTDTVPLRAFAVIGALHAVFSLLTLLLASTAGAPFVLWFPDTPILLFLLLVMLLLLGIVWDGSLIALGLLAEAVWRITGRPGAAPVSVEAVRPKRFFNCGLIPVGLLLATAVAILGTSNVTLLNMELLAQSSHWRDAFLWQLEGGVLERITALQINPVAWDRLYHSAWGIEITAAFALIVIARGPRIMLHYCVTMITLFYIGRLLGVLNPVMGPAFFKPGLFGYLAGSVSAEAMRLVSGIMALPPEQAMHAGGVLLGGVSAMPSLHVAMVSVTAWWLARGARWTAWITIPWVILVWSSTVVLGWHYILDGAGGMVLGAVCVWLTQALLRRLGMDLKPSILPLDAQAVDTRRPTERY
ncbi:phosphatase PAP2 family protein [Uliginosibacterium aquaticum]|uniref:Phosphatase PAP2 family protein n=1 Tax=Uliginosibacterium aquaticum TaxID=2731212 RepID=A0ABX2IDU1_9RHOO|nr:phosphatase PAP2 family protein [Uliginosibacterium aquaticum]NSL54749.1 phosphatase PAP2 family protein [Uliginosibacterium aquaticum]